MMCAVVVASAVPALAIPTITNLGVLDGGSASEGFAISGDGSAVAGVCIMPSGNRAFRWTIAGLDDVGVLPGCVTSWSGAISGDGSVIAGFSYPAFTAVAGAFRWTSIGAIEPLNVSVYGCYGISSDGSAIVGTLAGPVHAFRWTSGGGAQDLGVLPPHEMWMDSHAKAISANGTAVVGQARTSGNENHAFRWTGAGGMQDLGILPDRSESDGIAVSSDGSVVVGFGLTPASAHAFRWTAIDGMQDLGTLPGGDQSRALAISADGTVIGGYSDTGLGTSARAVFWTEDLGIVDLQDYLSTLGTAGLEDWLIVQVNGISANGSAMTGRGFFNGQPRGWIVTGITYAPTPCPGDVNGDGSTNISDFNILASQFGQSVAPNTGGDLTGDGLVNIADFNILAGDFGCAP